MTPKLTAQQPATLTLTGTRKGDGPSTSMCIRLPKRDADLLKEAARNAGFSTMGGYVRSVLRWSLGRHDEASLLLDSILRLEFLVAENFKLVSPKEDHAGLEAIRKRAEAVSSELLEQYLKRHSKIQGKEEQTNGR